MAPTADETFDKTEAFVYIHFFLGKIRTINNKHETAQ